MSQTQPQPQPGSLQLNIPSTITQGLSSLDQQASAAIGIPRIQSAAVITQFDWLLLIVSNILIFLVFVFILQFAWNNSVKNIFKLTDDINLLDAFLLLIVSRILFN